MPQNNEPPQPTPAADADEPTVDAYVDAATAHWGSQAGYARAHLDKAVLTLPLGLSVNPAGAAGLEGCSDARVGVTDATSIPMIFDDEDPLDGTGTECLPGSVIGTVSVRTPLLDERLEGQLVLGTPKSTDPESGQMFRMFIVVRSRERGLIAKIGGSAVADPATGQLTATFAKNPRLPFDLMSWRIQGGDRGLLAMPQRCGSVGWSSVLTPWTAAHSAGGAPTSDGGDFVANANCGFGFAPRMTAGTSSQSAGGGGTFSLRFSREDGEQWIREVTATMPRGFSASLRGVPVCGSAAAAAGACPAESRIGWVDAGAGSGTPYFLEKKGTVYLTEGYKGAPYGLSVVVPVEAGPFRGELALSPIVVRQALHIDRSNAQVTAISDPLPVIHHGIPLRGREVTVHVDRPGFVRNPTGCSERQTTVRFGSPEGAQSTAVDRFQVAGCRALAFRPKLRMRLTGRRQTRTGRHPGIKATLNQPAGEAGIQRVEVRLPGSLAFDPENAGGLCEYEQGTAPDLENRCPKASIVGRARAVSPLLNRPLQGDVYFVKNVRIDPRTGNRIRTLPMIVVALRGEIAINLRGRSDTTKKGRLVSTFADVPDAPVTRFDIRIDGGKRGIIAVTRTRRARIDICKGRHTAAVDIDGHNGRRADQDVRMTTPCPAKKKKMKKKTK